MQETLGNEILQKVINVDNLRYYVQEGKHIIIALNIVHSVYLTWIFYKI